MLLQVVELMQGLAAHEIDCLISNAVDMRTVIAENKVQRCSDSGFEF